ncbi:MAG: hypothetical protein HQ492_02790, partial [Woeseiaceae bacterium]|nr:hypothetical protein [Woeseiaceae bacterium]
MRRAGRNSRWNFDRAMRRYMAEHPTRRPPTTDDPHLNSLITDGIVVLPEFHDTAIIQTLHDRILPLLERVRNGEANAGWKTLVYREDGIYRLEEIDTVVPEATVI